MISIQTSRLQLIPLDHEMLQIWNLSGRESLEKFLQLLPNSWEVEKFYQDETELALRDFWLPMTKKFPLEFTWYTNWEMSFAPFSARINWYFSITFAKLSSFKSGLIMHIVS